MAHSKRISDTEGDKDFTKLQLTPKTPSPQKNLKPAIDPTIRKRIHDLIIDLHGCVQKWEKINQSSFQSLTSLVNLLTQIKSCEEEYDEDRTLVTSECWRRFRVKLLNLRESLINDHVEDMKKLEAVYIKMKKASENLKALSYMNLSSDKLLNKDAIFNTWSSEDFYLSARSLLNCYTKEWLFKQEISNHYLDRTKVEGSQRTLLVSMWLHQPYIGDSCHALLESMLLESGIR